MTESKPETGAKGFVPIPLDELFLNHDEYSEDPTSELSGRTLVATFAECGAVDFSFSAGLLEWRCERDTPWGTQGADAYEAVGVRPGIFTVSIDRLGARSSALVVLDLVVKRVVVVLTELVGADDSVSERTRVFNGTLGDSAAGAPERTDDLVGLRLHHRYSTTHAFEHIYIDANHYVWHGIEGPEIGMGGYEPAEAYSLGDDLYLFTWHEIASPFNGTIVIDLAAGRSVGRLFGWHLTEHRAISVQTGSVTSVLNRTDYAGL